ncbi:nucleotidyltransferase domain-containing protein [Cohnella caldifontis]|uniref:nucleotidyltransferase domain-containing protein n=1 Tax=Cohnella caldifontis TaxID=3027471 RepID=UPI0023EB3239|nr:nucleotidyltransferase family protein [Cohnella sp. YIM B05605]
MKIVELLNRAYGDRLPLLPDDRDYAAALEETAQQYIAGQVYEELKAQGRLKDVPAFFLASLIELRNAQSVLNLVLKAEGDRVVAALDDRGIPAMVLKGARLSERLYGNAGVRSTSDIDLLVKPEDLLAAGEIVRALGYESLPPDRKSPYHTEFTMPMPAGGLDFHVELHWHLVKPDFFRLDCLPLWERATRVAPYGRVYELSAADLFYTLCLHGAKHGMSSLKHVLDIVAALRRYPDEIEFEPLLARAQAEDTYGMVVMCLSVVYRLFPLLHRRKFFGSCRNWFPWNQRLAWKRVEGYAPFRGGFAYYVQRTIFELAKYDRNRYRARYLRELAFQK